MVQKLNFLTRADVLVAEAFLVAVALPSPAFGQEVGPVKDVTESTLTLDTFHESNVARGDATVAALRGLTRGDERITPGVEVNIVRSLGRNPLKFKGFLGYDFYRQNTKLNQERLGVSIEAGVNAGPCLLTLSPKVSRRQSSLSEIYYLNTPGIDSVRNTETVQTYSADLRCGRVFGLRPIVGYERQIGDNSNAIRAISDNRMNRYTAGFSYENPVAGNYTLTYQRTEVRYPRRPGTALAALDRYNGDNVVLSVERTIGAIMMLDGSVSYHSIGAQGTTPGFKGVGWNLAGTLTPAPRLQLTLGTGKMPEPSLGSEALFSVNQHYDAKATYALSSRTRIFAGLQHKKREYRGATSVFGPLLAADKSWRADGGVSVQVSPRWRVSAEVGHEKRDANGTIYDYSSTYAGIRTRFTL